MINRVILCVIDGLGVGAMPDASEYGDAGAHTLADLANAVGGLRLPTLEALGLGSIAEIKGVRVMAQPEGCFGRLAFQSKGVDSLVGYWELAGHQTGTLGRTYSTGFPADLVAQIEQVFGRKILGQSVSSRNEMVRRYGAEHAASGALMVWTDGRRTCHVAAHEAAMRPDELYQRCRDARKALKEPWGIGRVAAHPFVGDPGSIRFNPARRDFVVEPPGPTMLDILNRASQILIGVGKVGDLFSGRGLTRATGQASWTTSFEEVTGMLPNVPRGLIFAGLDLFDDAADTSAASLQEFDRLLPEWLDQLRPGDLFLLTGDHGRDMKTTHCAPTREYVPLIASGPRLAQGVNFGIRPTASDVGQTVVEALRGEHLAVGDSFLDALRAG
jgi:phosphopentomutase